MNRSSRELLFDLLVFLAAGGAHASIMLGIGVDPLPTALVGIGLVGAGVLTVVPRDTRVPAVVLGVLGSVLAGTVVPIYATRAVRPGSTLRLSLLLAGIVLLVTFALIRLTAFRPGAARPA